MSKSKESSVSKEKALYDFTLDLISKLHKDYLLLNRICYKVKHQYHRQKQFQYITQYKKYLHKLFTINKQSILSKSNDIIMKEIFLSESSILPTKVQLLQDLILRIGGIMLEMLKLKLYPSYTIIILGIMSRANSIIDYFNKNHQSITQAITNIHPDTSA